MSFLQDFLDLPRIVVPYILHPLAAIEVFLPQSLLASFLTQGKPFDPNSDIPSLQGKVVIVTGGNAGLGQETIGQLAKHRPARIYLAARSEERAKTAIEQIQKSAQQDGDCELPDILWLPLDLSDFDSVKTCANEILAKESRLDILVLNAGVMAMPAQTTLSGHDIQLCTNHIGHFLLVKLLLPLLQQTALIPNSDVRIITLSSEAHRMAPPNFQDLIEDQHQLCSSSNYTRYGVSKAANVLFASELARRYGSQGLLSVSIHPGIVLTSLYSHTRDSNVFVRYGLSPVANFIFDDLKHGVLNTLWCIAAPRGDELENGQYYTPVGRLRPIDLTKDEERAKRLWTWTEDQVKEYL